MMYSFYTDDEMDACECFISLDEGCLTVEFPDYGDLDSEGDPETVTWEFEASAENPFEYRGYCYDTGGHGVLFHANDGESLQGSWSEGMVQGMWLIQVFEDDDEDDDGSEDAETSKDDAAQN